MLEAIEQKPKEFWLNLMVRKGLITEKQASKNLVRNEILGYVTPKEIENAVELKAIKRIRNGNLVHYVITTDEIIINGKKKLVASQAYLDYEKKRRARQGASYYKAQEMDAIIHQKEADEVREEIDKLFPGSISV